MTDRAYRITGPMLAFVLSLPAAVLPVHAQAPKPEQPKIEDQLTPEELQERERRKDCKVRICSAFHVRKPDGSDIACNVLKTWRKEQRDRRRTRGNAS